MNSVTNQRPISTCTHSIPARMTNLDAARNLFKDIDGVLFLKIHVMESQHWVYTFLSLTLLAWLYVGFYRSFYSLKNSASEDACPCCRPVVSRPIDEKEIERILGKQAVAHFQINVDGSREIRTSELRQIFTGFLFFKEPLAKPKDFLQQCRQKQCVLLDPQNIIKMIVTEQHVHRLHPKIEDGVEARKERLETFSGERLGKLIDWEWMGDDPCAEVASAGGQFITLQLRSGVRLVRQGRCKRKNLSSVANQDVKDAFMKLSTVDAFQKDKEGKDAETNVKEELVVLCGEHLRVEQVEFNHSTRVVARSQNPREHRSIYDLGENKQAT